jgi:hypothetical protein
VGRRPLTYAGRMTASFAELDALPTEDLRERAFAKAREHRDLGFFWSVFKHLPDADDAAALDGAPNTVGPTIDGRSRSGAS